MAAVKQTYALVKFVDENDSISVIQTAWLRPVKGGQGKNVLVDWHNEKDRITRLPTDFRGPN